MTAPVIAVSVNNGGAGKSTICRLLAEWVAVAGARTLVVDTDDTAMLTSYMLLNRLTGEDRAALEREIHQRHLGHWLLQQTTADSIVRRVAWQHRYASGAVQEVCLDLVPAHPSLATAYDRIRPEPGAARRLRVLINREGLRERYDLILIDAQPGLDQLGMVNAVLAADAVIIPAELTAGGDQQVVRTLQWIAHVVRDEAQYDHPVQVLGVIANRLSPTADARERLRWLTEDLPAQHGVRMLGRPIPARAAVNRANATGEPIAALWRECDASVYAAVGAAVLLQAAGLTAYAERLRAEIGAIGQYWQRRRGGERA